MAEGGALFPWPEVDLCRSQVLTSPGLSIDEFNRL